MNRQDSHRGTAAGLGVALTLGACLIATTATARDIWVDAATGDDANDGSTEGAALASISRAAELAAGGDLITVKPGVYYERPTFDSLGSSMDAPVWIRAHPLGHATISGMWPEAAQGQVTWQDEGGGVYSTDGGPALFGSYQGTFLIRFNSVADLQAAHAASVGVDTPPHGFAFDSGRIYVRLPGNADPNGQSVLLSPPSWGEEGSATVVRINSSPYVILDGFRIEGAGTICTTFSADSVAATVRNSVFAWCRYGLMLPDDSIVEWSEYVYPGFHDFAEQIRQLNGDVHGVYQLVKEYHPSAWLEGGLADTYGSDNQTSNNCEFRYNFLHETFDGESLGDFEYSESHHNVYLYNYDNHIELESWANFGARELRLHHNLFLACPGGPISHQEESIVGPHYVYRNVTYGLDEHGWPSWTQIKSKAPNASGGIFYYHNLLWGGSGELFWDEEPRDILHFRNNLFVFEHNTNHEAGAFDSDYNILINDSDMPWLYGPNGSYQGTDPATLGLGDVASLDFGINAGSPAENAGVALPGFNDGAPGGPDVGPFEAGDDPGSDWPRPRQTTFTCDPPERWNGAIPEIDCGGPPAGGSGGSGGSGAAGASGGSGASSGGAGASVGAASDEDSGCGCTVPGTRRSAAALALAGLGWLFLWRRRRCES